MTKRWRPLPAKRSYGTRGHGLSLLEQLKLIDVHAGEGANELEIENMESELAGLDRRKPHLAKGTDHSSLMDGLP